MEALVVFIPGITSIIIQKKTLCQNKIRVIYFCPNCVNFLREKAHFFYFSGGDGSLPPSSCAYAHKKKALLNKTSAVAKNTNMGIWVAVTSNQLFVKRFLN